MGTLDTLLHLAGLAIFMTTPTHQVMQITKPYECTGPKPQALLSTNHDNLFPPLLHPDCQRMPDLDEAPLGIYHKILIKTTPNHQHAQTELAYS